METAVLRVICKDRPGLVADVAGLLFRLGCNILHADQHIDPVEELFFQRIEFAAPPDDRAALARTLADACESWDMRSSLRFADEKRRLAILVSKHRHCALDLLERHRAGELACDIPVVASNHPDLGDEVRARRYPFAHLPITDGDKASQEARLEALLDEARIDVVVLARYMQILSAKFVERWHGRILNIHHSFLPAFPGASPYQRAWRRGVKLVGATSHYVTADLDEGPIISQDVIAISHRDSAEDMERKGRDVERRVLAHAVRCHLEDRVVAYGNRTVVFD